MAELLVKKIDFVNPDPEIDRIGAWKSGMVIVVQENNHLWGIKESKQAWIAAGNNGADWHDKTFILKLPTKTVLSVQTFLQEQYVDDSGNSTDSADGTKNRYRRREWHFEWTQIPQSMIDTINSTGELTLSTNGQINQVKAYMKRIRDNEPLPI